MSNYFRPLVLLFALGACACAQGGRNPDLRAASEALTNELGIEAQVAYRGGATRLLVILPDSSFPDSAIFTSRAPAIARAAVQHYRRSSELDSVIVETRVGPASQVAFRVGRRMAFAMPSLR